MSSLAVSSTFALSTRLRILRAATTCFQREGYLRASIGKIMRSADLTVGGFYYHFNSKDALLAQVISHTSELLRAKTDELTEEAEGSQWIREFIKFYLGEGAEEDEIALSIPRLVAELPYAGTKARKTFAREFETTRERLMGHLQHIPEGKRESVVISTLCLCLGAVALSRALPESRWKSRILEICRTEAQDRVAKA